MNQLPRRALSRYGLTFQGNILSVNCQCRMLTRVRRTHSTSPVENSLITNPQEGEMDKKQIEALQSIIEKQDEGLLNSAVFRPFLTDKNSLSYFFSFVMR